MDAFNFDPPEMAPDVVREVASVHWGVRGDTMHLRGERAHNTRFTTSDGRRFILQVQSAGERPDVIDLQTSAMLHLAQRAPDVPVSRVVPNRDGASLTELTIGGERHLARLVTYLPGVIFDSDQPLAPASYRAIGEVLGRIASALADFSHPAAEHFMPWNITNGLITDAELRSGAGADAKLAIEAVDDRLQAIAGLIPQLPHQVIHNDGHAGNLVRADPSSEQVTGVIDFGDVVWTATVADVAIAAESFAPDHDDPAAVVSAITAGYHRYRPLDDAEIAALPELVLARAALTVLMVDYQIEHAPHLAEGAARARQSVIERLGAWAGLDTDDMIDRSIAALEPDR